MENKITNSKARNASVDIFRLICAILVVSIHTIPFKDINPICQFIFTQVIVRIAVPFFFAISGYFYIKKLIQGKKPFFPYFKSLLTVYVYVLWSAIYFLKELAATIYNKEDFLDFLLSFFQNFFIYGSSYHLWFFPAMFFCLIFVELFYKLKWIKALIPLSLLFYFIGCLGCAYYNLFVDIPIIGSFFAHSSFTTIRRILLMGLPFFISGHLVDNIISKFSTKLTNKISIILYFISLVIWIAEICLCCFLDLQENIIITFGLYPLLVATLILLIKNPFPRLERISKICLYIANFTYYSHPLFIFAISFIFKGKVTETPTFLIVVLLTMLFGYLLFKINNKFLNKFVL